MNIPTLETDRLVLRPFSDDDAAAYAQICGDPDVTRYAGTPVPDKEEAWRHVATFLGHWALRGYGLWAVDEKETGEMIGRAGLWNPEGWPDLEVGWLFAKSRWNRGYATEAGFASLDYAFERLGAEHVVSVMHPDNKAAHRVATKLGETYEGKTVVRNRWDVVVYGITRPTWEEHRRTRSDRVRVQP